MWKSAAKAAVQLGPEGPQAALAFRRPDGLTSAIGMGFASRTPMKPKLLGLLVPMVLPGCGNPFCFTAKTLVDTPRGPMPIENLSVGDSVWSFSLESRRRVARPVKATLRRRASEVRRIRAGGRVVAGVTVEHPFYDLGRAEYRPVRDLVVGDLLAAFDETGLRACPIESVAAREVAEPRIEVFNLTIDGPEANYFAEGFLVHNKSPAEPLCPDGTVIISVHAAPDASMGPEGDYDVALTRSSEPSTFSILIMREDDQFNAPPQLVERLSDRLYRARLVNPAPGNYDITASGYLSVLGPDYCHILAVRRDFTIGGPEPDGGAKGD
jgi:hypothetical protein